MDIYVSKTSVGWSVLGQNGMERAILAEENSKEDAKRTRDHLARCLRTLGVDVTEIK